MKNSTTERDPIIRMRDVSVSFGSRRVLDSVSLDVQHGEILVFWVAAAPAKQLC